MDPLTVWISSSDSPEPRVPVRRLPTIPDPPSSGISVEIEHLYVLSYSGNTLTVDRGVNGTTAASHTRGTAIDIYGYPAAVVKATVIQIGRLWRSKDAAFSTVTGFQGTGQASVSTGLDPDARLLLGLHRKHAVGVGV